MFTLFPIKKIPLGFMLIGMFIILTCIYSCYKWDNPYDENAKIKISINFPCLAEINNSYSIELTTDSRNDFNVQLDLYKGDNWVSNIAENVPSKGTITWKVPVSVTGSDYKIKATSSINSSFYSFSNNFEIANWSDLSAVTQSLKTSLFIENFNDNSNSWSTNSTDFQCTFNSGIYQIKNVTSSTDDIILTYSHVLDASKNFQIELNIKYSSSDANAYTGFIWGADLNFINYYEFWYLNNMNYHYGVYNAPNWTDILASNTSPIINGFNQIIIRKISGNYYFFINGQYIGTKPYQSSYGNYFGFESYPNSTIYLDYLYIYYINFPC